MNSTGKHFFFLVLLSLGAAALLFLLTDSGSLTKHAATTLLRREVFPLQDSAPFPLYGNNAYLIAKKALEVDPELHARLLPLERGGYISLQPLTPPPKKYMHDPHNRVFVIQPTEKATSFIEKRTPSTIWVKTCTLNLSKVSATVTDTRESSAVAYVTYTTVDKTPFASFSDNCDDKEHKAQFIFSKEGNDWKLAAD